jgi:hypothetical protein
MEKSSFLIGKPSINGPFSMAMFVYQRVNGLHIFGNHPEIWVSQLLSLGLLRRPTALEGQTWCAWL